MKKSKVFLIVAIALVAVLAIAGVSFAAWNNLKDDSGALSVDIGKQVNVEVTVDSTSADAGKILVPTGAILLENYVDVITLGSVNFGYSVADGNIDSSITPTNFELKMYAVVTATTGDVSDLEVKIGSTLVPTTEANATNLADGTVTVSFAKNATDYNSTTALTGVKVVIHVIAVPKA